MLYSPINLNKPLRIQGCFVSTEEIEHVIQYVKKNAEAEYSQEVMDHIEKQVESESSAAMTPPRTKMSCCRRPLPLLSSRDRHRYPCCSAA